jgi:DNA-binding NarL/FixJ family response regulator
VGQLVTRILVVDDHPSLRAEIVRLIGNEPDLTVVGEAPSAEDAVEKARRLTPDLVLMDFVLPKMNGAEATRIILSERPETLIVVLSNFSNPSLVRKFFEAGARAYVRKDHAFEELHEAIRTVVEGGRYVGAGIDADIGR